MHRSIARRTLRQQLHLRAPSRHRLTRAQHIQRNRLAERQLLVAGDVGGRLGGSEVGYWGWEALEADAGRAEAGVDGDACGGGGGDLDAVRESLRGVSLSVLLSTLVRFLGGTYGSSSARLDGTAVIADILSSAVNVELAPWVGGVVGDEDGGALAGADVVGG